MMSQYTIAALVGSLIDKHGSRLASLIAGLLFFTGFGAFAYEVHDCPEDFEPSQAFFYRLVFYFLLTGFGTVFGYFSSLFAASKAFPQNLGLASGFSMALFGLSPLFLCSIATSHFKDHVSGLINVTNYMSFLALSTGIVFTIGYFNLAALPSRPEHEQANSAPTESTPLLDSELPHATLATDRSIKALLKDFNFYLLLVICVVLLGAGEMVISNIGTIVMSLASDGASNNTMDASSAAAFQVKLFSVANTVTRITVGPLADLLVPSASPDITAVVSLRKHRFSRYTFLSISSLTMALTFAWTALEVRNPSQIWVLSLGIATAYSSVFTILPSIISAMWGIENVARNFGILMYAPFTGTPAFSYIYAFISEAHTQPGTRICQGVSCWYSTFLFCASTSLLSLVASLILWKRWHGKI
ncbi:hypothetical protein CVT24_011428 [Panaeolus cyanescens]|uniref:Nodulin-like domain-containing protein n=1 Tax=Panaeolus cyanescens TaxID=181874 RepID=A0A409YGQ2_9AGAR|nr:hypothetical protein CVT24_011428 [Panaeolus cyanescens]